MHIQKTETFIYILCIHRMYTMTDLFENKILCNNCNKVMTQGFVIKEGFKLRILQCPNCNNRIYHPLDLKEYEDFTKIRGRQWEVKLRMVGNSYTVSIPREIIEFEEQCKREMESMIRMTLDEPTKLSLFLCKRQKIIKPKIIKPKWRN